MSVENKFTEVVRLLNPEVRQNWLLKFILTDMYSYPKKYDVIVIGSGHAWCRSGNFRR